MSDREALDLFLGDMAGHQAVHAGETTPSANQALAAQLFERLDQKAADAERRMAPVSSSPDPVPDEERPSRKEAEKRGYTFKELPDPEPSEEAPPQNVLGPRTLELYEKINARLRLLLSKVESGPLGSPSWRDRVLAAQSLRVTGRTEKEVAAVGRLFGLELALIHARSGGKVSAARAVIKLINESDAAFGSWKADAPRKMILT
jgi:hypothetical protein